ncbi:sigma-70 family RNA polymerase sigma factor [Reichenbachiella sp. MALMAid0571]|uniref:sigma-70 family RNA polymerase sigma factor n=1 Tax=Reichenbachiella sp. MALMAid0571 TaxID=3143939 RepID=UPI0032DFF6D4
MIDVDCIWKKICEENDPQAFSDFFDHFYPKLFGFSLQYVKIPSGAEEVVSDVIYNLLKDKNRKKHIDRVNAYLFQSVKNKSLNWLRDRKKNENFDSIEQVEDYIIEESEILDIEPGDLEVFQLLEDCISQLPTQRQMVYRLLREDGLFLDEVAELLNLSKRTVEKHLELAVKELCQQLKSYLQDQRHHPKIRKLFPRSFVFFFL